MINEDDDYYNDNRNLDEDIIDRQIVIIIKQES